MQSRIEKGVRHRAGSLGCYDRFLCRHFLEPEKAPNIPPERKEEDTGIPVLFHGNLDHKPVH